MPIIFSTHYLFSQHGKPHPSGGRGIPILQVNMESLISGAHPSNTTNSNIDLIRRNNLHEPISVFGVEEFHLRLLTLTHQ
jgi:hypothetical protein